MVKGGMKNTTKNASPDLIATLISTDNPPELKPAVENPPAPAPVPDPPAKTEPVAPATPPLPQPAADGAKVVSDGDLLSDPPPAPPAGANAAPVQDPPPAMGQGQTEEKRGRGRPPGSKTKKPDFSDLTPQVDFSALAGNLVDMSTGTAATMIGPEWHPRSPEERQMLVSNLANYLKAKDVKDIPPGWMLVFVVGAYSMPRFSQPATKEKLRFGWTWIKIKVIPFFRRKRKSAAPLTIVPKAEEPFKDGTI